VSIHNQLPGLNHADLEVFWAVWGVWVVWVAAAEVLAIFLVEKGDD
jgi:hypothetical protein